MHTFENHINRHILSVSELTHNIKQLLEETFPILWICGEISNLRIPASGHAYFTLKDDKAQISSVMFKGQLRNHPFELEDGLSIVGMGRISVYEPRGTYQVILEYAEPQGLGALQIAFEQLKRKLDEEGLFDEVYKKELPFLPRVIGIITSPTGAVIQDLLNIIHRRFPNTAVEIMPVRVQGQGASAQITNALGLANRRGTCDIIILARGGGSLEDMAPFNSESVARAIFESSIPVVSAVGHETDFTISDFVADLRAPTPSAAAELVMPLKNDLIARVAELNRRSIRTFMQLIENKKQKSLLLRKAFVHPQKKVQEFQMRIDDLAQRLQRATQAGIQLQKIRLHEKALQLSHATFNQDISQYSAIVDRFEYQLKQSIKLRFTTYRDKYESYHAMLNVLNPKALLSKGYSITRTLPRHAVVTRSTDVNEGQDLEVLLSKGRLQVKVDRTTH